LRQALPALTNYGRLEKVIIALPPTVTCHGHAVPPMIPPSQFESPPWLATSGALGAVRTLHRYESFMVTSARASCTIHDWHNRRINHQSLPAVSNFCAEPDTCTVLRPLVHPSIPRTTKLRLLIGNALHGRLLLRVADTVCISVTVNLQP
jgi:hypothetical protein